MPTSRSLQRIEGRLAELTPGTLRYDALEAAKRFKTSWIELGRMLWTVRRDKAFREWGYLTFETYCAKEVGIKATTAKKLLFSYQFLEQEEPAALQRFVQERPATLPSADVVNVLRLLKRRQALPEERYERFKTQVFEQGREAPEIRRQIRELVETFQPDPEAARAARRQATLKRMIGTLKAVRLELATANLVPAALLKEIDRLTQKLDDALR